MHFLHNKYVAGLGMTLLGVLVIFAVVRMFAPENVKPFFRV